MLWTECQQKYFLCVDAFFIVHSGRAKKFDLSGLESTVNCSPRAPLGSSRKERACCFNGGWSYDFRDHWLGLFTIRKSQASPSKASLSAFFHLCHPGAISFHSVIASGSLFVTCKGVGESGKMRGKDLQIPFLIKSLKFTFSRDEKENLLMKNLFLSVYVPWVSLPFAQVQVFQNHVSVFVIHRDFCWHGEYTGATKTKKVCMFGFLFLSSFQIQASWKCTGRIDFP